MQVGADGFRDLVGAGISWVLNRGAQAAHASLTTSKRAALRFGRRCGAAGCRSATRERPRQRGERCAASSRRGIATVPSVLLGPGELASIAQRNEHAHDLPCFVAAPTVKIVPFGTAGGPIDAIARIYGKKLQRRWGQPVIVEAKPGDAGNWLDEPPRAV
ncbi:MAG TPA: hypothetical protein VL624_12740 [Caldimonas sp.]|nr:hypothetical protein [Caldimonas sp.]